MKLTQRQIQHIEQSLEPYEELIKERFDGHPDRFIRELALLYTHLNNDPDGALHNLMSALNYDPRRIIERHYPGALQRYAQMESYIKRIEDGSGTDRIW